MSLSPQPAPAPAPVARELASLPGRAVLPAPSFIPLSPPPPVVDPRVPDTEGVRRTLLLYQSAYERLDVVAAARIWPSLDRRALTRAFASIQSQGLTFESCDIRVVESSATARCRGVIQFVPKVGGPATFSAPQEWIFKMQKADAEWKIANVSASRSSAPQARRGSGES